jgi:hypothetical protein
MIGQQLPYIVRYGRWPNLTDDNHSVKSHSSENYNCIAWAYEVSDKRMWPGTPDYFWPFGVIGTDELEMIIQLYLDAGYEKCENSELEEGYKKVAIYVNQEGPQHAALQLKSGRWTSKLGSMQDIEHDNLEALEGEYYGRASVFLKKRRA